VLWLLMLRGISLEFRGHINNLLWKSFWDAVFCGSSILLAIFYGAALGNVIRGVPLNQDGFFFISFWTNFAPGANPGIIDWYTVLVGVAALLVLTMHGALWLVLKNTGALASRALTIASITHWSVCAAVLLISLASFSVQPRLLEAFTRHPLLWMLAVVAAAGLFGVRVCLRAHLPGAAFLSSAVFIVGLLCSAVAGLYPDVLPSTGARALDLTIYNAAAPAYGLRVGLIWWTPAFLLAIAYSAFSYRHFRGKTAVHSLTENPP
jgi:cytochrome d ubiquinol oxidase subunit II